VVNKDGAAAFKPADTEEKDAVALATMIFKDMITTANTSADGDVSQCVVAIPVRGRFRILLLHIDIWHWHFPLVGPKRTKPSSRKLDTISL
jgi:hypothetical protein